MNKLDEEKKKYLAIKIQLDEERKRNEILLKDINKLDNQIKSITYFNNLIIPNANDDKNMLNKKPGTK